MPNEVDIGLLSPEECVSEAMMLAFSRSVADQIYSEMPLLEFNQPHLSVNELTENATWKQCAQNSIEAVYYLASRYPDQFKRYSLITGKQGSIDKFKHVPWVDHTYFLVEGQNGTFYAGSPANYKETNFPPVYTDGNKAIPSSSSEYLNPLSMIFKANNIEDLMQQIHDFEGGEWPDSNLIEKGLTTDYKDPALEHFVGRTIEDDASEHDVIKVKAKVLEITTSYDEQNEPPNNTPIHYRSATSFRDMGSKLNPAELQVQIDHNALEEDAARELTESVQPVLSSEYMSDSKWI